MPKMDIFTEIKDRLETKKFIRKQKPISKGSSSTGHSFQTDDGIIFIKHNTDGVAMDMFQGELVSLEKIRQTKTIRAPKPMFVVADPKSCGAGLVMEYLELKTITNWSRLGTEIADLHLFNHVVGRKKRRMEKWIGKPPESAVPATEMSMRKEVKLSIPDDLARKVEYVSQFGFDESTCCGRIPQLNEWHDNWIEFYARNRLEPQVKMVIESYGNRQVIELWSELQLKVDTFFWNMQNPIEPALLHGDLWSGNIGQISDNIPVIFDPASVYGHSEFELSIVHLFGGYGQAFFDSYHRKIPKERGFDRRIEFYQLFHLLNHWNHFGTSYQDQSLDVMRKLLGKD